MNSIISKLERIIDEIKDKLDDSSYENYDITINEIPFKDGKIEKRVIFMNLNDNKLSYFDIYAHNTVLKKFSEKFFSLLEDVYSNSNKPIVLTFQGDSLLRKYFYNKNEFDILILNNRITFIYNPKSLEEF